MKRRLSVFAAATLSVSAHAQILTINDASLTTYLPTGASAVQDIRPLHLARGVGIDGQMRAPSAQGWALAGNPFGDHAPAMARVGDVNLATGAYTTTEADIALPASVSWPIVRSFNGRQVTSGDAHRNSNGYQGYNWFQMSQPAIVYYTDGETQPNDMVYIIYGADRFLEFKFVATTGDGENSPVQVYYRGVNGCAGVVHHVDPNFTSGPSGQPDTYVYYDQHGTATHFFGGNEHTDAAQFQIWKIVDTAGNTAYVGDASDAATALSGYNADGKIEKAYDSAGRRFCYSYSSSTIGGVKRLEQVLVETKTGENWDDCGADTMVAKVEYAYYDATESGKGLAGDLKLVTMTTPMTDSGIAQVKRKYYRYYDESWADSSARRGEPHQVKLVVGEEGTRNRDYAADSLLEYASSGSNPEFLADSDATLLAYSEAWFEYADTGDDWAYRVSKAILSGDCGCGGSSASGTWEFAYSANGSPSLVGGYDTEWIERSVATQPDGKYSTQYFDECGQPISRVVTDSDPSGSPSKTWATELVRDSSTGCVKEIHTPKNITAYTHTTGAFTRSNSVGLVHLFTRRTTADACEHFPDGVKYKEGVNGTVYWLSKTNYTSRGLVVGSATDSRPMIDYRRSYHTASSDGDPSSTYYDQSSMSYAWWSASSSNVLYIAPKQITTTNPTVTTGQNGSNSATTMDRFIREDGTTAYTLAPDGIYTYTVFTNGQLTKRIDDVITTGSLNPDDPYGDYVITESGNGSDRTTLYTYDAQGRLNTVTDPDDLANDEVHKNYYTQLLDGRSVVINWPILDTTSTPTYYGPASYTVTNHAGKPEFTGMIAITGGSTAALTSWINESSADPIAALTTGALARMSTNIYDSAGTRVTSSRVYHNIPGSGAGSSGTNYDATTFGYDSMGRRIKTVDPTGTITRMTFDDLGRSVSTKLGTDDSGTGSDNMVETSRNAYDGGASGGNSHLTSRTAIVDSTDDVGDPFDNDRVTTYTYDYRGRLQFIAPPLAPFTLMSYDNLGRTIATAQYSDDDDVTPGSTNPESTAPQTDRVALSMNYFDALGRVYKVERHKVQQSDGDSIGDPLTSNTWRDAAGRVIKVQGSQFEKTVYDRLGRATKRFILAKSNDSLYDHADDVADDHVLEEHQSVYESTNSDNILMTGAISRLQTDTSGTGALDSNGDADDLKFTAANLVGRIQITAMWYDSLHRVTDTVQYGTYGGSDFDRDGLGVPTRSSTALRTTTTYNDDGTVLEVEAPGKPTDPGGTTGTKTRYEYDDVGRQVVVINNHTGASPPLTTELRSTDIFTRYAFSQGLMTHMWADMRGEDTVPPIGANKQTPADDNDQVTTYIYGTTAGTPGENKVTTLNRLRAVKYPDSGNSGITQANIDSDSSEVVSYAYNAQGQETSKKDQAGTVIKTVYDDLGREIHRKATALGSGIDDAVERISTVYLLRGLPDTVTQYNDPDAGSVLDQVKYTYDDWGNLTLFEQDVDSTIVGGSDRAAFNVGYTYAMATGGRQTLRRSTMTGSSMNTVNYGYGTGSGIDDCASRVQTVATSSVTVATYKYLGTRQVSTDLNPAYTFCDPDYTDWDRFNRPIKSWWFSVTADHIYNVDIAYDRNGGIVSTTDNIKKNASGNRNYDVLYTNDDLGRLIRAREGKLVSGAIDDADQSRDERWMDTSNNSSLTQTGNWGRHRRNLNSDSDFTDTNELDDTRTHNVVNELSTRDTDTSGGVNHTLGYDAAGNMTDDGKDYTYTYDAFGRLRQVGADSDLVSEYRYNGLGMKIGWHYNANNDAATDGDDPWYFTCFTEKWQATTVFRGSDANAKERYIHHSAGLDGFGSGSYIDEVILRDKDANGGGGWTGQADSTKEERRYYLHNWRHDVVMVLTEVGKLVENVKYLSYGMPIGCPAGDYNYSGAWEGADDSAISGYGGGYDVRYDAELDGDIDADDITHANSIASGYQTLGFGVLSSTAVFSRRGYAGYELAPELLGTKYHVRHRVLDAELGRWTRRDPLGYVDGPSVYALLGGRPNIYVDPLGLYIESNVCLALLLDPCGWLPCPQDRFDPKLMRINNCGSCRMSGSSSFEWYSTDGWKHTSRGYWYLMLRGWIAGKATNTEADFIGSAQTNMLLYDHLFGTQEYEWFSHTTRNYHYDVSCSNSNGMLFITPSSNNNLDTGWLKVYSDLVYNWKIRMIMRDNLNYDASHRCGSLAPEIRMIYVRQSVVQLQVFEFEFIENAEIAIRLPGSKLDTGWMQVPGIYKWCCHGCISGGE